MKKAAHQRRNSSGGVVPQRVDGQAPEGGAVVSGRRGEGVENLAEAVRAGIRDADGSEALDHRNSRQRKNDQREDQRDQHRHLDVVGLDLFAQIFRRAPDHEARDKHGQYDVDENPVHARADAAENNFAQHDVDERDHAAQRREGIMPAVDGAATGVGGDGGEQRGVGDAEARFFAFHVAARLQSRGVLRDGRGIQRIALRLRPVGDA